MGAATGIRVKNPAHPGGFVKHEIIEPQALSVTDAARILCVARPALSALLDERATLFLKIALRIEKVFSVSMHTAAPPQNSYGTGQVLRWGRNMKLARLSRKIQSRGNYFT